MAKKTNAEISKLFKGTFETELGQRCLAHLQEVFVDRDIYIPGNTLEATAFRQGQTDIVKKIVKEFNNAR